MSESTEKHVGNPVEVSHLIQPYLVLAQAETPHVVEIGRRSDLIQPEYLLSNSIEADRPYASMPIPSGRIAASSRKGTICVPRAKDFRHHLARRGKLSKQDERPRIL